MKKTFRLLILVALTTVSLLVGPLAAQREPPVLSPEVHDDRSVTFRLKAPEARSVHLAGPWVEEKRPLEKAEDGMWSLTVGPLEPDIYSYRYEIDGAETLDRHNWRVKVWEGGNTSLLLVPGSPPAYWELRAVPHGELHTLFYESKTVGKTRSLVVYTPPGYRAEDKQRYPVLYLLHGAGDNESAWSAVGRAHLILDNLLAEGKAEPMIVVMPNGHPTAYRELVRSGFRGFVKQFQPELIDDVMPLVESRFRIEKDRNSRAIAGLSMGGGQALGIGLERLDLFSHVGAFSSAVFDPGENETFQRLVADPERSNERIRLLWIAIGKKDFLLKGNKALVELLEEKGIEHTWKLTEGDHSYPVWRRYLAELAPLLFR